MSRIFTTLGLVALAIGASGWAGAAEKEWPKSSPPHRLIGNVYNVGIERLSSYLIATREGNILIDTGFDEVQLDHEPDPARQELPLRPSVIRKHIEQLGFRVEDIKVILGSHAHRDHCGGHAQFRRWSGAKVMTMAADATAIRSGGAQGGVRVRKWRWEPSVVDVELHDLSEVTLGDVILTAHWTPGHTWGGTAWSLRTVEEGKTYDVVILDSALQIAGIKWFEDTEYPTTAYDYLLTFARLLHLPADVLLDTHGNFYQRAAHRGVTTGNPFIDPQGARQFLSSKVEEFSSRLDAQRRAMVLKP